MDDGMDYTRYNMLDNVRYTVNNDNDDDDTKKNHNNNNKTQKII